METLFPGKLRIIDSSDDPFASLSRELLEDAGVKMGLSEHRQTCTGCGASQEEQEFDELTVCKACGDILERPIDSGAEYRFFGFEDRGSTDPCRVGAPMDTRFPNSTLSTIILSHAKGGSQSARVAMARVRRYHTWNLLPYRERSLLQVFEQIAITATNNGFDVRTMDTAKELYVKLVEHCDRRGMSRTAVVASCIYSALKTVGQPRKPKEIADMFHLSSAQFTKSLKYFQEILCMANQRGLLQTTTAPTTLPTTRAADYISQPLNKLPISRGEFLTIREKAVAIATIVEDNELCPENMPPSLASGILAWILRDLHPDIPHSRIASVCGVSEGTLQKCLKKLEAAAARGAFGEITRPSK
jgi:transcription initiation factor TFIIIB Brf1 subunit/transcription initiation factor TFIIB